MARKLFGGEDFFSTNTTYDDFTSSSGYGPTSGVLRWIDKIEHIEVISQSTSSTLYEGTLGTGAIREGSVSVTYDGDIAYDDGNGAITGTNIDTGTIDYDTGEVSIEFTTAITDSNSVTAKYKTVKSAYGGEYISGTIIFPEWRASGIVELFGFEVNETHVHEMVGDVPIQLTDIRYQLSVDGGTTWKYWTGSSWTAAVSEDDFNGWETVDENISSLTFDSSYGYKSLRVKAKLYPDENNLYSPKIHQISILHELQYEFIDDALCSLKDFCDSNLRITTSQTVIATASQTVFRLSVHEGQSATSSPSIGFYNPVTNIKVYNVTSDPGKTTPLSHTFDGVDDVTLAVGATSGHKIFISYDVSVPVFIGVDSRLNTATSRAIMIDADDSEILDTHHGRPVYTEIEPQFSARQIRKRVPSQVQELRLVFTVQSPSQRDAVQISSALFRLLEKSRRFNGVFTGQNYEVVNQTAMYSDRSNAETTLYLKNFSLVIRGKVFYPDYITEPMVTDINVPISSFDKNKYAQLSSVSISENYKIGKLTLMSYTTTAPAIEVWDRNGLRSGVYTTLTSALASLNANGGRVVLGPGEYLFNSSGNVTVTKSNVVIEGCGDDTILVNANSGAVGIIDINADNFYLKNLRVRISNVVNDQIAIRSLGGTNLNISNVTFYAAVEASRSNPMLFASFGQKTDPAPQRRHGRYIQDCKFYPNVGVECVKMINGTDFKFNNNVVTSITQGTFSGCHGVLYCDDQSKGTINDNNIQNLDHLTYCIKITSGGNEDHHVTISGNFMEQLRGNPDVAGTYRITLTGALYDATGGVLSQIVIKDDAFVNYTYESGDYLVATSSDPPGGGGTLITNHISLLSKYDDDTIRLSSSLNSSGAFDVTNLNAYLYDVSVFSDLSISIIELWGGRFISITGNVFGKMDYTSSQDDAVIKITSNDGTSGTDYASSIVISSNEFHNTGALESRAIRIDYADTIKIANNNFSIMSVPAVHLHNGVSNVSIVLNQLYGATASPFVTIRNIGYTGIYLMGNLGQGAGILQTVVANSDLTPTGAYNAFPGGSVRCSVTGILDVATGTDAVSDIATTGLTTNYKF